MKQFLVLGCGHFGTALATSLYELGFEVVILDSDKDRVESIMNHVSHSIIGDATDENTLAEIGVNQFDTVIVSIGESLEANILATFAAKRAGAEHVISKVDSELAAEVLSRVGADEIIRPEHDMAVRLASKLTSPGLEDSLHLEDSDYTIAELEITQKLTGVLAALELPQRFGVQVILLQHQDKQGQSQPGKPGNPSTPSKPGRISPNGQSQLQEGDHIIVIGTNDAISQLRQYLEQEDT
jgi:trk system potassium uptake protein TrkA